MGRLRIDQIDLVFETLCASFWHKRPFKTFLRRCEVSPHDLEALDSQTKRVVAENLFSRYETSDRGHDIIRRIGKELCQKSIFTDLSPEQERDARQLIDKLKDSLGASSGPCTAKTVKSWHEEREDRLANEAAERMHKLAELESRLTKLYPRIGEPQAGLDFEKIVIQTARAWGIDSRDPYVANGRQFDGSVEVGNHVYLVESKFTDGKTNPSDISNFRDKIRGNADYTQGLFVSMSGYTASALESASQAKSPLVLLDGQHLLRAIFGTMDFAIIIARSWRNAAETGRAFVSATEMFSTAGGLHS